jgi:c(7)-type cytochrome triheme protein
MMHRNVKAEDHRKCAGKARRRIEFLVLGLGIVTLLYCVAPTLKATTKRDVPTIEPAAAVQDFSKFSHGSTQHTRMPCLLCHQRNDNSTRPKMPGHSPCSGCHQQQFNDASSGICNVCHTNASTGAVKGFPTLQGFTTNFDHAGHMQLTNCATCHKATRQGVAFSVPARLNGHATCFQCHGPDRQVGDRNIGSCSTCHTSGRPVRITDPSSAYRVNFSHSRHLRSMSCSSCHTVRTGVARSRQVTMPAAAMHFAPAGVTSCASCHNGRRTFGANDFANCKRCHVDNRFRF